MNTIEKQEVKKIEDLIKTLAEPELRYLNKLIVQRIKLLYQAESTNAMQKFNIGDYVQFKLEDERLIKGRITKFNKKTISVQASDGHRWNVSPQLLCLLEEQ